MRRYFTEEHGLARPSSNFTWLKTKSTCDGPTFAVSPLPGSLNFKLFKTAPLTIGTHVKCNVCWLSCHAIQYRGEKTVVLEIKEGHTSLLCRSSMWETLSNTFYTMSVPLQLFDVKEEHHSMTQAGHYVRISWGAELVEFFSLLQKSKENAVPAGYISHESCQHCSPDSSQISRWLL